MLNFCTLFDSRYAARGLTMYKSLCSVNKDFHLYIFAFDDLLASLLTKMHLDNVTIVSLSDFEDMDMLQAKKTRTATEYCWTCSSCTIYYCLTHYNIDNCIYIDADLFFYSDPQVLLDEVGENDVLITSHRYTHEYDLSTTSGKYCVQFVYFRNTKKGLDVLKWWRQSCLNWCYDRLEDGKFGDQKYLDEWQERFEGVHVLKHLGGGVAPWNMQQYSFAKVGNEVVGLELATNSKFPLVFFHFHGLECNRYKGGVEYHLKNYVLPHSARVQIIKPYVKFLKRNIEVITGLDSQIGNLVYSYKKGWIVIQWLKHKIKRILKGDNKYFY